MSILDTLKKRTGKSVSVTVPGCNQYGVSVTETVEYMKYPKWLMWVSRLIERPKVITSLSVRGEHAQ